VQIVDDQHDGLLERLQIRQQPFDHELAAQDGSRADPGHGRVPADDAGERVDHRQPEPLAVALAALDRHPRRPLPEPGRVQPRADKHRLAASRRPAHHDDAAGRRGRQALEQLRTLDQPPPARRSTDSGSHGGRREHDPHASTAGPPSHP
jgi:hypothetical protein